MGDSTPEEDYSTAKFVISRMRVVWGLFTAVGGVLLYAATHIYDFGVFMESQQNHEDLQDSKFGDIELRFKLHGLTTHEAGDKRRARDLNALLGQHDAIRELILESMPAKRRTKFRREFTRQRARERDLLLDD